MAKGGEHPDHAEQSGTDIAERPDRIDDRWPLRQPLVFIDARHALDHRCIGSPVDVRRRRVVPEAGDREVDRCGVDRLDGVVPDAEAVGGARLEVLAHDVGGLRQFEAQTHAVGVLEVQGHRALVEVVAQEGGTHRRPSGSSIAGIEPRPESPVPVTRPSLRRHPTGQGAGSRRGGRPSVRWPGPGFRRAVWAGRRPPRWRCRRGACAGCRP